MTFIWKCNKCGYSVRIKNKNEVHDYIEPRGRCPKCGTTHEEFKLLYA